MNTQVVRLIILSVITLILSPQLFACTDFRLTAKDGTVLISRSMEFPVDMKANLRSSPRGRQITAKASNGGPGLSWKAKYGYLSIDGLGQDIVVDGVNDAGLSFEYLYLPGETQYPVVPTGKEAQSLPYYLFGDWILGNFKTVDEVKQALNNVYIYLGYMPGIPDTMFPVHASIYEANGKGIVIEFVAGKVNIYDNIGIMTNSPTYDWQVTNLRNYLNLSPYNPKSITVNGVGYSSTGQGSGSIGLPGDVSPPSRFAKIAFLTTAAFPATNKDNVVNLAEHIINDVDIPSGIARSTDNGKDFADYTQWVVFKDLTHKIMYYRTYDDLTLRSIDMSKVDLSEKAQRMKMPLAAQPYIMDMTAKFTNGMSMSPKKPSKLTVGKINAAKIKN
jgi:choloylglycine hydrolase